MTNTFRRIALHRRLFLEALEDRRTPAALTYTAPRDGAVTLLLRESKLQIVDTAEPSHVLATRSLQEINAGVIVSGRGYNLDLTIDASVPKMRGGIFFDGGAGQNSLFGPARDITWTGT